MAKPRVPEYDLFRIQDRRLRIRNEVLVSASMYHLTLDASLMGEFAKRATRALRLPFVKSEAAVRATLMEFSNQEITEQVGEAICLKLAGGYRFLKQGEPLPAFSGMPEADWVPIEISEMRLDSIRNQKTQFCMTGIVMAGLPAGRRIRQIMPGTFVVYKFARELGWPRFERSPGHAELVRMWFTGRVQSTATGGIEIVKFHALPAQERYNKKIRKERELACIKGYSHECHVCSLGYTDCHRSTHRYTWVRKPCKTCKNETAIFDPEQTTEVTCLRCKYKKLRAHWSRERMTQ